MIRMIVVTAVTATLGVASPVVLDRGLLGDSELVAWVAFFAAMVLVAAATAVGTSWSGPNLLWGSVVGLLLAAPPVSVMSWIWVIDEGDPQGPILSLFVTVVALAVSGATWAAIFGLAFWLKNRATDRAVAPVPLAEDAALRAQRHPCRGAGCPDVPEDHDKIDVEERWLPRASVVLRSRGRSRLVDDRPSIGQEHLVVRHHADGGPGTSVKSHVLLIGGCC